MRFVTCNNQTTIGSHIGTACNQAIAIFAILLVTFLLLFFVCSTGAAQSPTLEERMQQGIKPRDVLLEHTIDPQEMYLGQQAISTLELLTKVELGRPQFNDLSFDDFWQFELPESKMKERFIGYERYRSVNIRRVVFPQKTGTLTVPERTVDTVAYKTQRMKFPTFGGMFSMETIQRLPEEIKVSAPAVTVIVRELPPHSFSESLFKGWGASTPLVGLTTIAAAVPHSKVDVGIGIDLSVEISSLGNLGSLSEVPLTLGEKAKIYPDSPTSSMIERDGKVIFTKKFKISVVPLVPGELQLGPLQILYFDPQSKIYTIAKTNMITLTAVGDSILSKSSESSSVSSITLSQGQFSNDTPHPTLRDRSIFERFFVYISPQSFLLIVFSLLSAIVVFYFYRISHKNNNREIIETSTTELESERLQSEHTFAEQLQYSIKDTIKVRPVRNIESLRAQLLERIQRPEAQFEINLLLDQALELETALPADKDSFIERFKSRLDQIL